MSSAALLMGVVGSLHCIGMCGPLAMSLSSPVGNGAAAWWNPVRYNAGRIFTYTAMGLFVALLGEPLRAAGWQQGLSIIGGAVMLAAALGYLVPIYFKPSTNPLSQALIRFRSGVFQRFKKNGSVNRFVLGLLNGLLPCGLVYMALGGAAMQRSFTESVLFMTVFGLGTAPAMMVMGYSRSWLRLNTAFILKAYPYAMLILAVLLLLRGMNLGIPYVSPFVASDAAGCKAACCH
ncbi:MAG TPA: sulfite exporter TauE/SafE family protein [Chitinophagales bacterium]|nr:sulfite exporter TauE/SafE family protein [Chitinophagales bacterium]